MVWLACLLDRDCEETTNEDQDEAIPIEEPRTASSELLPHTPHICRSNLDPPPHLSAGERV